MLSNIRKPHAVAVPALAAALIVLALCGAATATQTDNRGMHAVPVPGPVVIDGKLDDWDLSGSVLMCYDVESLLDVYSARVAMMYDADNLYVAIRWVDATPMGNSHDPRYQADRGWAGDCVQLRLRTDRISHVTAWCYGAKQEPALYIDYGKDLKTPFRGGNRQLFRSEGWKLSDGAEMAFLKNDDGKGYVQELKLPWKLIASERTYKAGDEFNCGFELLWGEADWPVHRYADNLSEGASGREFFFTNYPAWGPVRLEPKGNLTLPPPAYLKAADPAAQGPVPIGYDLPEDARVTLAIDDAAGRRVRNLTPALPRSKGHNQEKWDGLDDDGKSVAPGEYAFKAIYHQPVRVNWVMSFANPGNPTWQTPDDRGSFYGDHSAPQAVAAAGDFVALACPIGEAGKHLIGCDASGKRLWGLANRGGFFAGRISLATDGRLLWVAQDTTGSVYRVHVADGKYAAWNASAKDEAGRPYAPLDVQVFDPAPQKVAGAPINLTAVALRDGVLAVCLARDGKVRLLDADTGAARGELAVADPRAAAWDRDGSLVVVSKDRLVRLAADGKATPMGDADLAGAFGLAIDERGDVFVSVRGTSQNVRVLDRDGRPTREIGRRGGRPRCGPFDDGGMLEPAGIALGPGGRLWVTEEAQNPKRTSVWNAADGKFLTDFVGSTAYAAAGAIDAYDPATAFSDDTVYHIDLATGAWRPTYSLARGDSPDDAFPPTAGSHSVVRRLGGRDYVYTAGTSLVRCMTFRDGRWHAVAAVGLVGGENDRHFHPYWHPSMAGHAGEVFAWSDLDGDGLVRPEEMTFSGRPAGKNAPAAAGMYWGFLPDADGVVTLLAPAGKAGGGPARLLRLPVLRWTDRGVPVYDAARPTRVPVDFPALGEDAGFVMGGAGGRVYVNQKPLVAVGPDGRVLWTYPSSHVSVHGSHNAAAARPGYLIGPLTVAGAADAGGEAGEVFDLNGNLGEHYLFTADGLFVQSIFKDTRGLFETPAVAVRGMSADATTSGGEDFGANFVGTTDGKVYLTNGGTDARVHEVTGLGTIRRLAGRFTYTPEQYAAAQEQAQAAAARAATAKTYVIEKASAPPALDGKLSGKGGGWPELADATKPALEIRESERLDYARVAARYDDENLYLAWRVKSPEGRMRNAGQDDHLLFKTGDCVDLMLRPAGADERRQPGVRLLISTVGGKPVVVLYEKSAPAVAKDARVPFSSPWRTIYFDRVRRLEDVKVAAAPVAGGYLVEAAVPWADLGIRPAPGLKLRGDVGVLSADAGGTTTVARHYWSNKATNLVNDVPGEADLTPALWGEFVLR